MWDKKLKLDFQNKNSNQAKSHLKQIDASILIGALNADELPVALNEVVPLGAYPKRPHFPSVLAWKTRAFALPSLYYSSLRQSEA